jgi:ABC-2 type transport system permease protein
MNRTAELQAIYVMWLRQIKRFLRSKSRLITSVVQPLFFLFILGSGFRVATFEGVQGDYIFYLAPGIIAMSIMFSSMFAGISVLWDKQFGFLQEVLVAPVSRFSIIIGRTLGGATTALFQGSIILIIVLVMGIPISSIPGFLLTIVFMLLIAFSAVGFGLILASKMQDFQGFPLIMNLVLMPLLFLSSAFFPVSSHKILETAAYINPMFYMVDGLRGSLTGTNNLLPIYIDLGVVFLFCIVMMLIGSYMFSKSEA